MEEATYHSLPEELELRELRVGAEPCGFPTKVMVVTTLLDAAVNQAKDLATVYSKSVRISGSTIQVRLFISCRESFLTPWQPSHEPLRCYRSGHS
jgi:hypothetical protein